MNPLRIVNAEKAQHRHSSVLESRRLKSVMGALAISLVMFPAQSHGGTITSGGGRTQVGGNGNVSSIGSPFATSTTQTGSNANLSGVIQVLYKAGQSQSQDSDGDLMPDQWETQNGLNPAGNDAALDPDGDGVGNLSEYVAGTNPKNSASKFTTNLSIAGSIYRLQFQTTLGRSYEIQGSVDLTTWVSLYTLSGSGATEMVPFDVNSSDLSVLLNSTNSQKRFFRVIISIQ